jgi:thioredoxin
MPSAAHPTPVTRESFGEVVRARRFAIVDFSATWCPPCRAFEPVFAAACARHPELLFATVNTDNDPELAAELDVRAQPTIVVFRDGHVVYKQVGAMSAAKFEDMLERVTSQ